MGYSRSSIDLIRDFVAGLQFPVVIDTVASQGAGVYLLTCDNLYHAQATFKITIGGKVYTIVSIEDEFTMTVKGATAPAAGATFNMYPPFFFHGTPLAVGEAISQEARERNNTPMIWMLQNYTEHEFKDPQSAIEKEITCRLYFLTQGGDGQYGSPRSHDECVKPMLRLKDYFIAVAQQTAGLFQMVDFENDVETFNKFGVYIADRGMDKNWFSKNLSGVLLEATWKLFRNGNCQVIGKPVSPPCDPVRVTNSNDSFDESYPAGSLVELDDQQFTDSNRQTSLLPAMTSPIVALPKYEAETQIFIDAALLTDETQTEALNVFVRRLKGANKYSTNIYPLFKAIWPLIGGTALKHSYNLIDPTKFQLAFFGSATHNASGITGDGITFYADTGWNGVTEGADKLNLCFGSYAALGGVGSDMGVKDAVTANFIQLLRRSGSTTFTGRLASSNLALGVPQGNAMAMVQRIGNTLEYVQGKDIKQSGTPSTLGNLPNLSLFLFTFNNNGVPSTKGTGPFMLFFIAEHLGANEREIFNDAVKELQIALGRLIESDIKDTDNAALGTAVWGDDATLVLPRELVFYFDAAATDDMTITIGANQKGTYTANSFTNVDSVTYEKNAVAVSLPFSLAAGDTLKVIITRTTPGQNSQVNITGSY